MADEKTTEAGDEPATTPGEPQTGDTSPARPPRRSRAKTKPAPATPEERRAQHAAQRAVQARSRRVQRQRAREKARGGAREAQATAPRERGPGKQKVRQGVVVSDKAQKTITVRIDVARRHSRYDKVVRTSQTLHVHDEQGDAHIGDTVVVRECRPMSATKRWRLVEVLERAE